MAQLSAQKPHIITVGNEKGGVGKTTLSIHLSISLMYLGFRVGTVDVDSRQRSLTSYLEQRHKTIKNKSVLLPFPQHTLLLSSSVDSKEKAEEDDINRFLACLDSYSESCDFIIIDTLGSNTPLSRIAHQVASTLITPLNDSFLDLNVLASIEENQFDMKKAGYYSEMVWKHKLGKAQKERAEIDWVVVRNRLTSIDARNKRNMVVALEKIRKRLGFRMASGFGERVIFRELFLEGLTLLDIMEKDTKITVNMSHLAARQELRHFLKSLHLPLLEAKDPSVSFLKKLPHNDKITPKMVTL